MSIVPISDTYNIMYQMTIVINIEYLSRTIQFDIK